MFQVKRFWLMGLPQAIFCDEGIGEDNELARVDQKLNNENFVSRAPEDVVQELRDKRVEHEGTRARVAEALKRLG